jgi:predicted RNA-binding Zn-ribbon protein involved in translation (DUF1610 family)
MKKLSGLLVCIAVSGFFAAVSYSAEMCMDMSAHKTHGTQAQETLSQGTSTQVTSAEKMGTGYFEETVYTCPMHPQVRQDKPGKCQICGMTLEPKKVCYNYECTDKSCEYMANMPAACPMHKGEMKKTEVKTYCPNCGKEVKPEDLKVKPAK